MITVTAGMGTPDWVYKQGIPTVEFDSQEVQWWGDSGAVLRMPVPWNDEYLLLRHLNVVNPRALE